MNFELIFNDLHSFLIKKLRFAGTCPVHCVAMSGAVEKTALRRVSERPEHKKSRFYCSNASVAGVWSAGSETASL